MPSIRLAGVNRVVLYLLRIMWFGIFHHLAVQLWLYSCDEYNVNICSTWSFFTKFVFENPVWSPSPRVISIFNFEPIFSFQMPHRPPSSSKLFLNFLSGVPTIRIYMIKKELGVYLRVPRNFFLRNLARIAS